MTSFNKINGIFAGGNSDLCNRILREEWGYEGFLVTDWGIWILWWMARMQLR